MPKNIQVRGIDYVEVPKVKKVKSDKPMSAYNKFVSDNFKNIKGATFSEKMTKLSALWAKEKKNKTKTKKSV
jgi:hypothetical protein